MNEMARMWSIYALLTVVTLIAGLTPIAARMAATELPPLTLAFARFGIAALLLAITAWGLRLRWTFQRRERATLLGLAALCVPINQVGFLVGVKLASATHAAIAYALVPVLVFWTSLALRRTTFAPRMTVATGLAVAGACAVVLSATRGAALTAAGRLQLLIGDGLLLSAAVSWTLFVVLSQPVVRRHGAIQTLTAVFLIGSAMQIPLVLLDYAFFDLRAFAWSTVTWRGITGLAFITLITAYTNYLLWYLVIARSDVTRSSVIVNFSFVITAGVDAAFLGQRLSWWAVPGCGMLVFGIVLATMTKGRPGIEDCRLTIVD